MVSFASQSEPQPEAEVEEDFALADSFINFDYEPDIASIGSDPIAIGSGSTTHVEEPEPECEKLGTLGCANIEQGFQKISLVGGCEIGGNGDVSNEIIPDNEGKDESESSESESATSSSSSSSSDGEDEGDDKEEKRNEKGEVEIEEGEILDSDAIDDDDGSKEDLEEMASWGDDDDGDRAVRGPIRSKNEPEILPSVPPVSVTLEPHHQMLPVGVVMSILGAKVIVEGVEKHDPLNEGSILWMTESRTPLGLIDEIFGPVKNPYYVVRYNSENEVPEGIHGGTLISFIPEFANHVLNNKDLHKKGYDASGCDDEELSDEADFSDDEKEAEYKRMQRMTKRGINDQNPGKRKNNRKKVPPKEGMVPTLPVAPATPLVDQGHCSPFSAVGQGLFGPITVVPPFPPTNAGPNLSTCGVWTNGTALPQPQSAVLPNGFPTNGVHWYPEITQISHQLPAPGIPFQQQLNPSPGYPPPATMFPGVHPNLFAQPRYAQGLMGQNQMTFGLSSPFPQIQPPINFHSTSIPGNQLASNQFNPGSSANHWRKTFHRGVRKGWRPAK